MDSSIAVAPWMWGGLAAVVLSLMALDLAVHRGNRVDSPRRALLWSLIWIGAALAFNGGVWAFLGPEPAEEFLGVYLLEESLSVDNLFVFLLLFRELGIPHAQQRRVLIWGILGAFLTRGLCIALGVAALQRWHWLVFVLGGLLIFTALRMLRHDDGQPGGAGKLVGWLRRRLPLTEHLAGSHFFVRQGGRWLGTPLLLALVAVELTDVVFALDSVPAAFAVTDRSFIIYSANVFALLGLRSLYVVLAAALTRIRYLRFGLAGVLALAGIKMIASRWVHVPALLSVGAIALCIAAAVVASLWRRPRPVPRRGRPGLAHD
jgi:tellurite resistance protein TerC